MKPARRLFARLLVGLLTGACLMARAQSSARIIGRLEPGTPDTEEDMRSQSEPLRALGWEEGSNLVVERRYANNQAGALERLARELVQARVEIIVTGGTAATLAAMHATSAVPIVFRQAHDPVRSGLVSSLARPGSNVTGFSAGREFAAKNLSLLKEMLPALKRVGVAEPTSASWKHNRESFVQQCRSLGMQAVFVEVAGTGDIKRAMMRLAQRRVGAVVLPADSFVYEHRYEMTHAALRHGLATMAELLETVEAGALAGYSIEQGEEDRRAASYVDRILRGAKPEELPVEQPTKLRLAINLKTARALGVPIPAALRVRADRIFS